MYTSSFARLSSTGLTPHHVKLKFRPVIRVSYFSAKAKVKRSSMLFLSLSVQCLRQMSSKNNDSGKGLHLFLVLCSIHDGDLAESIRSGRTACMC